MSEHIGKNHKPVIRSLGEIIRLDPVGLSSVSDPSSSLTREFLEQTHIDNYQIAIAAEENGIMWPDTDSSVVLRGDSPIRMLVGDDADQTFAMPIIRNGSKFYNNFPAIIGAKPLYFDEGQTDSYSNYVYGTKPYLIRAHMLCPEFMHGIQQTIERLDGMKDWNTRMVNAITSPENSPEDVALLTGSRIAYTLLANLMRNDDYTIQARLLGMDSVTRITDPVDELRA